MSNNAKLNKILLVLVPILIVVVAIQAFFLFKPNTLLAEFLHRQSPELNSPPAPTISLAPVPSAGDKWLNTPFDPDTWNPFEEMQQMQRQMDGMFENAFGHFGMSSNFRDIFQEQAFAPKLDLQEEEDRYMVRMDLPGVEKTDVDIHVDDSTLVIKGKREEMVEQGGQDGQAEIRERRMGEFERSIELPQTVDAERMTTDYKDGTLTIILPKVKS